MILKQFFDIFAGFRFSKMQWGSVPSIPAAVLVLSKAHLDFLKDSNIAPGQAKIQMLTTFCRIFTTIHVTRLEP